jgi:hypothetical protein
MLVILCKKNIKKGIRNSDAFLNKIIYVTYSAMRYASSPNSESSIPFSSSASVARIPTVLLTTQKIRAVTPPDQIMVARTAFVCIHNCIGFP